MTAPRSLLAALVLPLALLAGCAPEPPPVPLPQPVEEQPTPTAEADPLPADALLSVTALARAANGARLELRAVVRAPQAWNLPAAKPGLDRLLEWCDGEVDQATMESGNFTIVPVEYSAKSVGDGVWPDVDPIWLIPEPGRAVLAATGSIHQVELGVDDNDPGDYVPHCVQNAILSSEGEGTVYLGFEGDTQGSEDSPIGQAWAGVRYGFTRGLEEGVPTGITFEGCSATITPLGTESGAPGVDWQEDFQEGYCAVGGAL